MKKKIVALVLSALMVTGLVGCGSNNDSSTSGEGTLKVGMITNSGTIDDKSFNQGTWEGVKEYEVDIQKVSKFSNEPSKGLVIKIVDEELLGLTHGIIQGMSGSPIIQNNKIFGAVTHVIVNNPTTGYGIFITNMFHR